MLDKFKALVMVKFPFLMEGRQLLAISGGLDSTVLAHLCTGLGMEVVFAHCNFNLRGAESDGDAVFVKELATHLDCEVFVQKFDTERVASDMGFSIQMAARELRYAWFEELREAAGLEYILTAHHANDDVETLFINLSRGTGLDGLTGIPQRQGRVVRPLLSFGRAALESYARQNNLQWREDSSNASDKYLRNAVRHKVVPEFEKLNPTFLENMQQTRKHLIQAADLLEDYTAFLYGKIVTETFTGYALDVTQIKELPHPKGVLYQLLHLFGFSDWDAVYDLLDAQAGKQLFSPTHRLVKDRGQLLLSEIKSHEPKAKVTITKDTDQMELPGQGILFFDEANAVVGDGKNSITVDGDLLRYPLNVRNWREGDYFYPLGMQGKKKVSKYLKDEKLSLPAKENVLLLCSGEDIVWIIGHRADDHFKVTPKTKQLLKITYRND